MARLSSPRPAALRVCARAGCVALVKKQTAKYCSVQCSSLDPDRRARLRERARSGQVLPLARQLRLDFESEEMGLAIFDIAREEIPLGLSRWAVWPATDRVGSGLYPSPPPPLGNTARATAPGPAGDRQLEEVS